ncbi:cyclodeaminase/cyclohydrolase family protein [Mycetocola zhujimingii]|uniref:cyclodeaminase/cyclohydrolase family protein n=1 Tax=Mycetocola zhujimingii TaxID=2079792 RepID=UPI000D3D3609|nr:cyclodeaminase/cyclohydrolase family protein [Mycetocola zhujimingii]AWB85644.1 formiminotransferase-cyclodeaminase [Mycetocola zhujimingii]
MNDRAKVSATTSTIEDWTDALARATGSPGGGAASGVMLAMAYALTSMVAGYTEVDGPLKQELDALKDRAVAGRRAALHLADEDAAASKSFGSAFRLEPGEERENAIREASVTAAETSADLGRTGADAVGDLEWLAQHGNPALVADVAVACGALRAAVAGARTNMSFDLGSLTAGGESLDDVRKQHPALWETAQQLDELLGRIDRLTADIEGKAVPAELQG